MTHKNENAVRRLSTVMEERAEERLSTGDEPYIRRAGVRSLRHTRKHSLLDEPRSALGTSGPSNNGKSRLPGVYELFQSRDAICVVCQEPTKMKAAILTPCRHTLDLTCLAELFKVSIHDEASFPPRCCQTPIPLSGVHPYLPSDLVSQYKLKAKEYQALKRVYCSKASCSRFLAPLHEGRKPRPLDCRSCGTSTCNGCRATVDGSPHKCKGAVVDTQLAPLISDSGWATCPGCGRVVERVEGCKHMTCRCKTEFCYICHEPCVSLTPCECAALHRTGQDLPRPEMDINNTPVVIPFSSDEGDFDPYLEFQSHSVAASRGLRRSEARSPLRPNAPLGNFHTLPRSRRVHDITSLLLTEEDQQRSDTKSYFRPVQRLLPSRWSTQKPLTLEKTPAPAPGKQRHRVRAWLTQIQRLVLL